MKKATLLLCLVYNFIVAQNQNNFVPFTPSNHQCYTQHYQEELRSEFTNLPTKMEFENWLAPKIEEYKTNQNKGINSVISIPVVVHVIHNGDAVGSNENISDARVLSQINVLNEDYRRQSGTPGFNTNSVGADVEIEFCMAQVDPNGQATNGIHRVNLGVSSWNSTNAVETQLKPSTSWNPNNYFNIWVCEFGGQLDGILGYAYTPAASGLSDLNQGGVPANRDGVIIEWRTFGDSQSVPGTYFNSFNRGRTATHEIGHSFGLNHTWGDGGCSVDDFCADTPNCDGQYYAGAGQSTNPPSQCGQIRMVSNYLDYSADFVMNTFTQDQKARVQTVLANSPRRNTLGNSNACTNLSSQEFNILDGINLYPNPANNFININLSNLTEMPEKFVIYNMTGKLIKEKEIHSATDLNLNISNYPTGVYIIKITKNNSYKSLRFIKK